MWYGHVMRREEGCLGKSVMVMEAPGNIESAVDGQYQACQRRDYWVNRCKSGMVGDS